MRIILVQEGKYLPVPHCIKGTDGWQIRSDIAELLKTAMPEVKEGERECLYLKTQGKKTRKPF